MVAPLPLNAIAAPKLATVVARQIENQIVALGWPVGEVLGSEAELLERFGVSRAVLREAVRIVEHTGAALMRRGPGGGLVVAAPNRGSITTSISIWFSYVGVTVGEMFDARLLLMVEAMRNAAQRQPLAAIAAVQKRIAEMEDTGDLGRTAFLDLDNRFIALSDNPAVVLFAEVLSSLMGSRLHGTLARIEPALTDHDARQHLAGFARLADRLAAGDVEGATVRTGRLLGAVRNRLKDRPEKQRHSPTHIDAGSPKLAERVAIALREDIERAGWPIDTVLGSESELIERYAVSRAILREAVRILEHDGAVRTKRGPGGGLVVAAPDSAAIVRAASLALEHDKVTPQQLVDVRSALEVGAARMTANSVTPAVAELLLSSVVIEREGGDSAIHLYEVHHRIAEASGCRPLALFVRVMSELVGRHIEPAVHGNALPKIAAQTHRAHQRIAEAIAAGDADLAERRMRRHLSAALEVLH